MTLMCLPYINTVDAVTLKTYASLFWASVLQEHGLVMSCDQYYFKGCRNMTDIKHV